MPRVILYGPDGNPLQPSAQALGDAEANPTTSELAALLKGYNGASWDRLRSSIANGLQVDVTRITGSMPATQSGTWTVQEGSPPWTVTAAGDVSDGSSDSGNPVKAGLISKVARITALATGKRQGLLGDEYANLMVREAAHGFGADVWTASHFPAANTQATITKASAGAGVRNVCTMIEYSAAATAAGSAFIELSVHLIDGASGGTSYLWGRLVTIPTSAAGGAAFTLSLGGLWLPGSQATAMTLEFSVAGGLLTQQAVAMSGVTLAE